MKLIGENSVSKYISYLMFIFFLLCFFHLIYELIGHLILFYKYKTGSKIFDQTFILGKDLGWNKNQWTLPMRDILKFKINYPFTDIQLTTGIYEPLQIILNFIAFLFFPLFFYSAYRIFRGISIERIFNLDVIRWLQILGLITILFSLLILIPVLTFYQITAFAFLQIVFLLFLGLLLVFAAEFFKKGYQLQSENDLTI